VLEVFGKLALGDAVTLARDDVAVEETEHPVRHEGHVVRLAVEMERLLLEQLDAPQHRGPCGLELLHGLVDPGLVREVQEPAHGRIHGVDRASGDELGEVVPGRLDLEAVVQHLVLDRIVLVELEERVLPKCPHREQVQVQRVVADIEPVHREVPEHHRLRARRDAEGVFGRLDGAQDVRVRARAADPGEQLWHGRDRLSSIAFV